MKVVVLCTDQGVRVPGTKGASLHLRAVAEAYAELGHEVLLLGVAGHGAPPSGPRLRTHLLPHPGRAEGVLRERNKLALVERFATEGAAVLADFAPDVVHERLALFGTAGLRLARAAGARHVVEVNALLAHEEARWRGLAHVAVAREREREVLRGADHLVPVSDELSASVRGLVGPAASVETVANGVDPRPFTAPLDVAATRTRFGLPVGAPLVVFTGTLRPWHGVELAVEALAGLRREAHLVVVGDGPVRESLAERAAELGVSDRLHLLGQRPHDEAVAVVRCADVAVAPYPDLADFSFSPLKVYEYLAAGVPVVASDLGQLRGLLGGLGVGTLVRPGDVGDLVAGIGSALDRGAGRSARRVAATVRDEWSWAARIEDVLRGLDRACTGPGSLEATVRALAPEDDAVADALRRAAAEPDGPLVGLRFGPALRRVAGRRVTFSANRFDEDVVVKAFSSPRARGNARRLVAFEQAGLADVVPTSLGTSSDGCVGVVSFRAGTVMEDLDDEAFVTAARDTGRVLARLHDSGAALDRRWTAADECDQLVRRAPDGCRAVAAEEASRRPADGDLVPAHRDLHPRQVVRPAVGEGVCLIDLDDTALAPRGLDVGNMVAHLRREAVVGRRSPAVAGAAVDAFLEGYGRVPEDLVAWERLALARLAGLAESRHGRPEERDALLRLLAGRPVPAPRSGLVPTGHADRPVRMCVDDTTGRPVVVKTYLGADGSRVHDDMTALWASTFGGGAPARMPEPLAFDGGSGDLVMARVAGDALAVRGSVGASVLRGADAGRLLAGLHGSGVALHRVRDRRALVRSARRKVASLGPDESPVVVGAFTTAVDAIEAAWEGTTSGPLVPNHGDFSPRNVHATESQVALIDLDRLQLAERERDLAYWCAWLWVTLGGSDPLFAGPAAPFLTAYATATGHRPDPAALDVHGALALVRIAHGWTSMRADDDARTALLAVATGLARGRVPSARR
ncbi:glycosyltransferase [Phycicoccus avicenniae]|uniref:glycosyltransferase n=1 Tax=Phycicoccus avicenniae TaxID=2828860 RepID=UPI003D2B50C4